jgi:hypothetical protein
MNKWISVLIAVLLSATASAASAGQIATLSVTDQSTGERLKIWRHGGRNYIAGNPGDRYAIEVKNQTGGRVLSVVSVDGVNVINGATASIGQSGYVLDGWQPLEIKGWRKSMDEVAAFYFTRLSDTYAARTGRAENVGVIGVALFREYADPVAVRDEMENRFAAAPRAEALAKSAASADGAIGTGHGERVASATRTTEFRRAGTEPGEVISIYYDTHAHLVARGIIPGQRYRTPDPVPFPENFVPDPS